jgi:hypothetical protein
MSEADDGISSGFDLMAWMRQEMDKIYAEEYARRWEEILFGPRLADMTESLKKASVGFEGITKALQGFDPNVSIFNEIWHVSEFPEKFTPAEFNRLWDSFTEERKVEYVLSLIT